MTHNNKEIEIKIALDKKSFLKLKDKVVKICKFAKKAEQVDEYFTPAHKNFLEPKYPYEWLSTRKRGNKQILNYKHFYPENSEINTHCDEFETEINNEDQLKNIFSSLNLKSLVIVEKQREVYLYEKDFEIALDDVKNLGYFVEIEAMRDFGSVVKTRKALFDFAKKLGLDTLKPDKRGYPYLLMKKKGLIK